MTPGAALTFLSLFAGIGGFDLGLERAGLRCAGQVEVDPFCRRVLTARWPGVPKWGDVRDFPGRGPDGAGRAEPARPDGPASLLAGGFPCQDVSSAGKRAGLAGARSGLFWEFVRAAKEFRPAWALVENVPGLFSSAGGRDMWAVLGGLRELWPAVGYRILDSRYFGFPQRRRRVFLVCGPDETRVAQVLFESTDGGGHPAACAETGSDAAATPAPSARGSRGEDDVNPVVGALMSKRMGWRVGADEAAANQLVTYVTHNLTGKGHDTNEDSTGRETPIIVYRTSGYVNSNGFGIYEHGDAPTLDTIGNVGIVQSFGARRLTPTECERLQGFPDGWTCLCLPQREWSADPEGAAERCRCPDSPRYCALGNAVTVPVAEWLGRRLLGAMMGA